MRREEFIQEAGGLPKSQHFYKNWSGRDKRDAFWNFFDEVDDPYIRSIYAGVSVDELRRKQLYSIEHIVPKSFLKSYLNRKNQLEAREIKGATTNPLNFAACHRNINSLRGNFPFDMDGDKVVRSYQVSVSSISSDYGLDREKEWVIPQRTQGDISRAVLYMCIIYGINELYGNHLVTYRNWALMDPPNHWEIAYNEWVFRVHKIRNPFVSSNLPAVQNLLRSQELMESILLRPS